VLVLLDSGWLLPTTLPDGRSVGGHADTLREAEKRTAVVERVLRPLLMRFGDHPAVLAWEVMPAPDRHTLGVPGREGGPQNRSRLGEAVSRGLRNIGRKLGHPPRPELPRWVENEQMREFLADAVALVHRHTHGLATVGVSSTAALDLVRGLGLDFYTADWDAGSSEETLLRAVSDLRLDRPLVLGSFPGRHPRRSIKSLLDTARCAGYGGAFVWSVLHHDEAAGYDGQLGQWSLNHADHLFHREVAPLSRAPDAEAGPRAESP